MMRTNGGTLDSIEKKAVRALQAAIRDLEENDDSIKEYITSMENNVPSYRSILSSDVNTFNKIKQKLESQKNEYGEDFYKYKLNKALKVIVNSSMLKAKIIKNKLKNSDRTNDFKLNCYTAYFYSHRECINILLRFYYSEQTPWQKK